MRRWTGTERKKSNRPVGVRPVVTMIDSRRVLPLVEEEPGTDVGAVDDVEGVDDIVEAD